VIVRITFYTRPRCGLCEEIARPLGRLAARHGARIARVNIDEDREARRRYWDKIPVIEIEGGPVLCAPIDEAELERVLASMTASTQTWTSPSLESTLQSGPIE
jgi:hypothetical protein